ncbi:MAG: hypothetical protein WC148_01145 [Bacilli bacterium]
MRFTKEICLLGIVFSLTSCANSEGPAVVYSDTLLGYGTIYKNNNDYYVKGTFKAYKYSNNIVSFADYGYINEYYPLDAIEVLNYKGNDTNLINQGINLDDLDNILLYVDMTYSSKDHLGIPPKKEDTRSTAYVHLITIYDEEFRKSYLGYEEVYYGNYESMVTAYLDSLK